MKKILILSYHFFPDTAVGARRPTELARHFVAAGYQVDVLTKRLSDSGLASKESVEGINISRKLKRNSLIDVLWEYYGRLRFFVGGELQGKTNVKFKHAAVDVESKSSATAVSGAGKTKENFPDKVKRAIFSMMAMFDDLKLWMFTEVLVSIFRRHRYDYVLVSAPPAFLSILAAFIAKISGAKLIIDLRDPFFQFELNAANVTTSLRCYLERRVGMWCLRSASLLVCASPGVKRRLGSAFQVKSSVVLNGYDSELRQSGRARSDGVLRIVYAGMLYLNRDPFVFLQPLKQLIDERYIERDKIDVQFVGDCRRWNNIDIEAWVEKNKLAGIVCFKDFIPQSELNELVAGVDVLLNLSQGQPDQIPAKSYDYMASGKEVLVVAEEGSDVASVFVELGVIAVAPTDCEKMKEILVDMYQRYAVDMQDYTVDLSRREQYSRACQNRNYFRMVDGL